MSVNDIYKCSHSFFEKDVFCRYLYDWIKSRLWGGGFFVILRISGNGLSRASYRISRSRTTAAALFYRFFRAFWFCFWNGALGRSSRWACRFYLGRFLGFVVDRFRMAFVLFGFALGPDYSHRWHHVLGAELYRNGNRLWTAEQNAYRVGPRLLNND